MEINIFGGRVLCNRFGSKAALEDFQKLVKELSKTLSPNHPIPNLEPREEIRPTDKAPILRPLADGTIEIKEIRWGMIPWFHKGTVKDWKPLNTNARSETIATTASFKSAFNERRCLIPFNHFFEWTGPAKNKTMWKFTPKDHEILCFAGIWDKAKTSEGEIESFALLTMQAGPEISPYHDRQPLALLPDQYQSWLNETPTQFASDARFNIIKQTDAKTSELSL